MIAPSRSTRLTGRGAVVTMFAACVLGLLLGAWTGWTALADAIFVMTCALVACYTRASGLRYVVLCPPLAFGAGTVLAAALTVPGAFLVMETILVTLGSSAPWLFTGTVLTAAIAFGRGYRPGASRPGASPPAGYRPRDPAGRSSRGSANAMSSSTASTSSTAPKP